MQFELGRHCAALVLDVQQVFSLPTGPFHNTTAGPMIEAINTLLAGCRRHRLPVVHSRYVLRDDLRDAGLLRDADVVDRGHMSRSSPWAELDPRLCLGDDDIHVSRNRPSAFYNSDLEQVLASLAADQLVLAGLSVNNAISATARDAFARDIQVVVVREATGAAPFEPTDEIDCYFHALHSWTAEVALLGDVLARLA